MEASARLGMMNYRGKCNTYLVLPSWTEMKICTGRVGGTDTTGLGGRRK